MKKINRVYRSMASHYGPQGWWPILDGVNFKGIYHPPKLPLDESFFEIAIGAILTQNVAWINVEKALVNLKKEKLLTPLSLHSIELDKLAQLIRPSGYYNQKALKIKYFLEWYKTYEYTTGSLAGMVMENLREDLLSIKGIGPETADSILLYGLEKKIFVIDAYTKRIFTRLNCFSDTLSYHEVQEIFHRDFDGDITAYKEYHALIVVHAKHYCKKNPQCDGCVIRKLCPYDGTSGPQNIK